MVCFLIVCKFICHSGILFHDLWVVTHLRQLGYGNETTLGDNLCVLYGPCPSVDQKLFRWNCNALNPSVMCPSSDDGIMQHRWFRVWRLDDCSVRHHLWFLGWGRLPVRVGVGVNGGVFVVVVHQEDLQFLFSQSGITCLFDLLQFKP